MTSEYFSRIVNVVNAESASINVVVTVTVVNSRLSGCDSKGRSRLSGCGSSDDSSGRLHIWYDRGPGDEKLGGSEREIEGEEAVANREMS